MKSFLLGIAVSLVVAAFLVAATAAAHDTKSVRTYVLRDGDRIVSPKLDLTCMFGVFDMGLGYRRSLDCGRTSTEMEGKRIVITASVAELWSWSEGPGWKLIARTKRNP